MIGQLLSKKLKYNNTEVTNINNLKWKFALQVSNIGVWDYDATTKRTSFSEESAKILGYNIEELNKDSESWNKLVHSDDKEKYLIDFQDHLLGKKEFYENISRIKHKDQSYRWILDKGKIIEYTNKGFAKRIIGIHIDITESKKKEEKIFESLNLISSQNKKLKNFAHIATHNLKEHSGNIESILQLYKDSIDENEKTSLIKSLNTVSETLKKTIKNLRKIVTINSTKNNPIESIKLKSFVNDSIKNLILDINGKNIVIKNKIDPHIVINFNVTYLESIIQNLLTNAIKYKHEDRYPKINIYTLENEQNVTLIVEDNGLGIDLDTFGSEIFGLYRTFHKNKNSEGVGLYITKNQIESLGGTIDVKSEINKGSKFIIQFPKKMSI